MSNKLIFTGKIIYLRNSWYAPLIFPFVQLKKLLQTIYNFLLRMLWSELIQGEKIDNEFAHLIAFIVFCLISLSWYYARDYSQFILIISFVIWYLDRGISQNQYCRKDNQIEVTLHQINSDEILWTLFLPNQKLKSKFLSDQVRNISISKRSVVGGEFQEFLGQVWQVEIYLYDGNNLVIDEYKLVHEAFKSAKRLNSYFQVLITFATSQGNNEYVEQRLDTDSVYRVLDFEKTGINCQKSSQKWHIYSQWRWRNSWVLIKQIIQKVGFLIFLLIMAGFMIEFGQLLDNFIQAFQDRAVIIDLASFFKGLVPYWNWRNRLELAIALIILIYQGWQLSRVKHIYLDQSYLKFSIDNQKINKTNIKEIETILLMSDPVPEILILAQDQAITITEFQQKESAQLYWAYLEQGIQVFKNIGF